MLKCDLCILALTQMDEAPLQGRHCEEEGGLKLLHLRLRSKHKALHVCMTAKQKYESFQFGQKMNF